MTLPAPEVRPDWTGPRITEWVRTMTAPKRPNLVQPGLPTQAAQGHPTEMIAERSDAPFSGRPPASLLSQLAWAVVFAAIAVGIGMGLWAVWS